MQAGYTTYVNGNPQLVFTPMTYEQQINYRNQMMAQHRDFVQQRLKDNFPTKYVLFHSICFILIGIVEIILQILLIINKGAIYYVGNGIWGGLVLIILGILTLFLIKNRSYSFLKATFILHFISIPVIFGAFIIVNAIGLSQYGWCYFSECFNSDMKPINIVMLVLGVVAFILCIIYFSTICTHFNGIHSRNQNQVYNPSGTTVYPPNLQNFQYPQPSQQPNYNAPPPYNSALNFGAKNF